MTLFTITQENPNEETLDIYPSASGCSTGWSPTGFVNNYSCVADEDVDTTYVSMATENLTTDEYGLPSQTNIGTINYVNLNVRCKTVDYALSADGYLYGTLNDSACTSRTTYNIEVPLSWKTKTILINPTQRDTNPITNDTWDWNDFTDLEIGIQASSPTRSVTQETRLDADEDDTIDMSNDCYEPSTSTHYTKINDYPYDSSEYNYRYCSLGYITTANASGSPDTSEGGGDLVVSKNDIIHTLTGKYLGAWTFTEASNTLTNKDTENLGNDGYVSGHSISVVTNSSSTTDYVLVAHWLWSTLKGFSYDLTSESYTLESTATTFDDQNYTDSCADDNYHYVVSIDTLHSIEFPDGAGNITEKDSQAIPNADSNEWCRGVCCDGTYVYTATENTNAASISAYSIAANGNITLQDTKTKNGYDYRSPYMACIDIGSETLIFTESKDGEWMSIWSYDHAGNLAWEAFRSTGASNDSGSSKGRKMCYEEDGKYYYASSDDSAIRLYEIDTATPDLTLVAVRNACTTDHENRDEKFRGIDYHLYNGRGIYLSNGYDLHAYQWKDYFDWFGFESCPTLSNITGLELVFVGSNACGDETEWIGHISSGGSTATCLFSHSGANLKLLSHEFTTDPNTGAAWVDSNISSVTAGVEIIPTTTDCGCDEHKIIQLYLRVNNTEAVNPEIRVSEEYLTVGYTPPATTCYLNKPEIISTDHARNVKMFNFWKGDREVYDYNRSGKRMVLKGREFYNPSSCTNPCSRITCVRDIAKNGATITISDLKPSYFSGDYRITQFGWNKISEKPEHYEWILELEDTEV